MKKVFLLIILCIFIASCQSEYEQNLGKMKKTVISELENNVFKGNMSLEILEYKNESYITKNENFLDTIRLSNNISKLEHFNELMELQVEKMKTLSKQIRLYGDAFGINDNLTQISKEDMKDAHDKMKQYKDSFDLYWQNDSLIKVRINERTNPKPVYHYKAYLKCIFTDNKSSETENFADTIYWFFDENLNLIRNLN